MAYIQVSGGFILRKYRMEYMNIGVEFVDSNQICMLFILIGFSIIIRLHKKTILKI